MACPARPRGDQSGQESYPETYRKDPKDAAA